MKRLSFKLLLVLGFVTTSLFAQKETVYKKSFDTNNQTILVLNLKNTPVTIEESSDGKIHFDYSINFKKYSKRKIQKNIDKIKMKVEEDDGIIKMTCENTQFVGEFYYISSKEGLVLEADYFKLAKKKKKTYKSKDSLLFEIKDRGQQGIRKFIKNFKIEDQKGNRRQVSTKDIKSMKSVFKIKVPSNVRIKIKGESSQVLLNYDMDVPLEADLNKGALKTKKLSSEDTNITIRNGGFEAEGITQGRYTLKDVSKCLIGEASHAVIDSEGSKVEIGEVGKQLIVKDFNSEFFFYNFSRNFKEFKVKGDYSKLLFYDLKNEISLSAFGNTTTINHDDMKSSFEPRKGGAKFKMLEKKVKDSKTKLGHVNVDITHGIINIISEIKE